MSKKSMAQMRSETRENWLQMLMAERLKAGDEALRYKGNSFAVPIVFENGEESCVQITVSIPTGSTKSGEIFDCYGASQDYMEEQEIKQQQAEEKAAEKKRIAAERKAKQEAVKAKQEAAKLARKGGATK